MQVARALSSKREENIVRILMVLGVIRVLGVADNLGSMGMSGLVRRAR